MANRNLIQQPRNVIKGEKLYESHSRSLQELNLPHVDTKWKDLDEPNKTVWIKTAIKFKDALSS